MQGLKPQRVEGFRKRSHMLCPGDRRDGEFVGFREGGLRAVRFFSLYGAIPPMGNEQVGISSA